MNLCQDSKSVTTIIETGKKTSPIKNGPVNNFPGINDKSPLPLCEFHDILEILRQCFLSQISLHFGFNEISLRPNSIGRHNEEICISEKLEEEASRGSLACEH